jgi:hypothetical protein
LEPLEPRITEELEPQLFVPPALELLSPFEAKLDEEAAEIGVIGDGESSEQALYIATAPTASKELNKRFFIIFLSIPRLKLDFIARKGTKKSFLKADM